MKKTLLSSLAALAVSASGTAFASSIVFDFALPDGTTDVGQGSTLGGNANFVPSVQGGRLHFTDNTNSNNTFFYLPPMADTSMGFNISFDYELNDPVGGNPPADGFSFNYGNLPIAGAGVPEEGYGAGATPNISWEVDTWMVGDAEVGPAIAVNDVDVAFTNGDIFGDGETITGSVNISLLADGTTTFTMTGATTNANFVNVASGFVPLDSYGFALAARTGGANEALFIDNLRIDTIPEPSGTLFLGLGLSGLLLRRRRN